MASTLPVTTFEVYMFENARWVLHARFGKNEREAAIAEARAVEKNLLLPSRVVRDVYRPEENTSDETVVYISDRNLITTLNAKRQAQTGSRSIEAQAAERAEPASRAERPGGGGRGNVRRASGAGAKVSSLLTTLALIAVIAGIGAGFITSIATLALDKINQVANLVNSGTLPGVYMAIFVGAFLLLSVPMARRRLAGWEGGATRAPAPVRAQPMARPASLRPKPKAAVVEAPPPEEEKKEEEAKEEQKDEEKKEEEKTEEAPLAVGNSENAKTMLGFLTSLLTEVGKQRPQLDAYNRFGINLMLVGGVEALGARKAVPQDERRGLLSKTMEVMGTKGDTAKTFADKYEDYLNEPKYLGMVRSGYAAMEGHLSEGKIAIGNAMEAWNRPQAAGVQAQIMTVMFTDMVGSTDITQQLGDKGAQEIVRRHNNIVRTTLRQFSGKEIKHTGDGIMASFPSAADGVTAAIAIQKLITGGNKGDGTAPELHVRIGINAGEPIQEEDDLFGATVQMAARVCAAAGKDEIMCSNVVRELAQGRGIDFESRGPTALKGFKDAVTLYEVKWH